MSKFRVRFAPSPTGYLHIGGLRTALFNYLFAQKNKGDFILRIEDTDQARFVPGATEKLIQTLKNMGIAPTEGVTLDTKNELQQIGHHAPYVQSMRLDIYRKIADKLINDHQAYYCFCSEERLANIREKMTKAGQVPKYDGFCRDLPQQEAIKRVKTGEKAVIRFKMPLSTTIVAEDLIYGKIEVKTEDLDDFVLMKSDGFPTYHLANIVDDHDMAITHVIRGEEWMPSLPKHIALYQALDYKTPIFVHLPLLLNPDRSKLSKRQGDVAVEDFLAKGYLPEALLNYVALLGWNPGTEQEIFSLPELIKNFSLEKINKSGSIFDLQKLNWFNAHYIRQIVEQGGERYQALLKTASQFIEEPEMIEPVLKLFATRIDFLSQLGVLGNFIFKLPDYDQKILIFKKSDLSKTKLGLEKSLEKLMALTTKDWHQEKISATLQTVVTENNLSNGDVFWPVRVAVSGLEQSPPPHEILAILKKEEAENRLRSAWSKIK